MNTKDMLFGIVIFAAGLLTGVFIGSRQSAPLPAPPAVTSPGAVPGGFAPMPGQPPAVDRVAEIKMLQELVQREPKNAQAWIKLGNDLFDTNQAQKSVEAYGRALELEPNNPDVLTDQGVMYRALGQFEQAIANFEKAQKLAPSHLQSLINIAVVYDADLKQPDKAVAALERVIQIDPNGQFGTQAKGFLQQIKARPGK